MTAAKIDHNGPHVKLQVHVGVIVCHAAQDPHEDAQPGSTLLE